MRRRYSITIGAKSRGFGILGWLVMVPVAIVALLVLAFAFYEGRKAYWDSEVKGMCEKDGGVKIFEKVELNSRQYALLLNQFGQLSPPLESRSAEDVPIVHNNAYIYIRRNNPEVRRDELVVIRKSDKKVLGVSVSYSRVGGDLIALHPSYFSCPGKSVDIFSAVVHQSKEQK